MPVNVPDNLPAIQLLQEENIFVMPASEAAHQDIRPLQILILNLMPVKITTETHLLRQLSNSPLQLEVTLMRMSSHESKNTPMEHLLTFYKTFEDVKDQKFDGMIITGAPVETLPFEEVNYWDEMKSILNWTVHNVTSLFTICWGAQAALYHFYGVQKYPLSEKMFGIFPHTVCNTKLPIVRGFDEYFLAPHSRHTELHREDIINHPELELVSESPDAGVYVVQTNNGKHIFVTGHSEYDPFTLKNEYERDKAKGVDISIPRNYYPNDDPSQTPMVNWRSHASLIYGNWLNYHVYQATPFDIKEIK